MSILSRNVRYNRPRFMRDWHLNSHGINIIFWLAILAIAVLVAVFTVTTAHSKSIPVSNKNLQQGPAQSSKESTADNVYTVGQSVYCWDSSGSDGRNWYPCKILGVEDNHKQYFIEITENRVYRWHTTSKDIESTGTYKGAY